MSRERVNTVSSQHSSFLRKSTLHSNAPQASIVYDDAAKLYTFIESSQSPKDKPTVPSSHRDLGSARLLPLKESKHSVQSHSFLSSSSRKSGSRRQSPGRRPSPPRMPAPQGNGRFMRPGFRSVPKRVYNQIRLPALVPPRYRDNSSIAIL